MQEEKRRNFPSLQKTKRSLRKHLGIDIYTLLCIKWMASGNLLYDTGNPRSVLCDNLEGRDGEGDKREV